MEAAAGCLSNAFRACTDRHFKISDKIGSVSKEGKKALQKGQSAESVPYQDRREVWRARRIEKLTIQCRGRVVEIDANVVLHGAESLSSPCLRPTIRANGLLIAFLMP